MPSYRWFADSLHIELNFDEVLLYQVQKVQKIGTFRSDRHTADSTEDIFGTVKTKHGLVTYYIK